MGTISRRRMLALAGAATAAAATGTAAGCSSKGGSEGNNTLTVASFYQLSTSGWDSMIAGFKKKHPGVTIKTQVTTNGDDYVAKMLAQGASGTLPDVIGCENSTMFPYFQSKRLLMALDEQMKKSASFDKGQFFPKILARYTVNGNVYGIPYDCQPVCGVFLNRKLFKEARLDVPDDTWQWKDILELSQKLTKKSGGKIVQYGFDPGGNWDNWVYANGGRAVDNVDDPHRVTYGTNQAITGMQEYIDLIRKYQVSPSQVGLTNSGQTSRDLFVNGKTAMFNGGYWELVFDPGSFKKMDLGYVMLPKGPAGSRVFQTGGTCYSVASGTKNADLAFDFVAYWMGMGGWKAAAAATSAIYPPAYIPAYKEVFMKANGPIENKGINGDAAQYALFAPRDPAWTEINTKYITPQEQDIEQGKRPVASTLKEWSSVGTPLLSANKHG